MEERGFRPFPIPEPILSDRPVNRPIARIRRSCATELVRGGANLWHVNDLVGHENLETLKHYTRLTIVDLKKTHTRFHPRERQG